MESLTLTTPKVCFQLVDQIFCASKFLTSHSRLTELLICTFTFISKIMLDQSIQFLTPEESADVDKALLTSPEKFLTRLTISTGKLLKVIAQDLDTSVEQLTPQQIIQWFEADSKRKQEEGVNASVLKWEAQNLDELTDTNP